MLNFLRAMPKVELHAHLNGSLNIESLTDLAETVYGPQAPEFSEMCRRFIRFSKGDELNDCFEKFKFVHELTSTRKGLQYATELIMRDYAKDNVIYVELRTTPKANDNMSRREYLETVLDAIKNASKKYPIIVKLLPSINRAEPVEIAEETVDIAIDMRENGEDIIVGIDFSGNPNCGKFSDFKPVLEKARKKGLKLAVHCAEIDNKPEIREMLMFGMSRCGHGTFLQSSDIQHMKKEQIPIECCLTSNIKSGTVSSIVSHHLKDIITADAPKVLCTDDSGVFNTSLTDEFQLACNAFGLSKTHCISMTMDAVQHSFATPEEKIMMKMKVYNYLRVNNKEKM